MRKLLAATVVVAALASAGVGHADPVVLEGSIQLGTLGVLGESRASAACDPAGDGNGFDGVWFALDALDGAAAELTLGEATSDADVYFFDAECTQIDYTAMAVNFIAAGAGPFTTNTETGEVPEGSAYVLVEGFFGVGITFTLTLTPAEEPAE
ncbi:MAG TPA: hypothetical protein VGB52_09325 [Actinomycetota bacterium]